MKKITLQRTLCKGCGICSAFCPKHVFDEDIGGNPIISRPEDCIACKLCVYRCPDFALNVEDNQ